MRLRRRLGWWLLVALLATGCTTSNANEGAASDQADVWFMQHMVPHLLQTTAIVELAGDRIIRPELARLADTIHQQGQADLQQLQGWLAERGLAPYDPQQDPDRRRETDLSRLSRVHGAAFDLALEGRGGPASEGAADGRDRGARWWRARGPGAGPADG